MWAAVLASILRSGTTSPQQIKPIESDNRETLVLYGFAALVLIVFAVVFVKLFSK